MYYKITFPLLIISYSILVFGFSNIFNVHSIYCTLYISGIFLWFNILCIVVPVKMNLFFCVCCMQFIFCTWFLSILICTLNHWLTLCTLRLLTVYCTALCSQCNLKEVCTSLSITPEEVIWTDQMRWDSVLLRVTSRANVSYTVQTNVAANW
ncbi:hypothetical protein FKM82_000892 [Ascaphus truei]